jgi:hypothetical protein
MPAAPLFCVDCHRPVRIVCSWATNNRLVCESDGPNDIHPCSVGQTVAVVRLDGQVARVDPLTADAETAVRRILRGRLDGPAAAVPSVASTLARGGLVVLVQADGS